MPPRGPAIWFNKRALTLLELPLPHSFTPNSQGWEVEFSTTGRLVARSVHGGEHRIDVVSGDKLIGSGEELYFAPKP